MGLCFVKGWSPLGVRKAQTVPMSQAILYVYPASAVFFQHISVLLGYCHPTFPVQISKSGNHDCVYTSLHICVNKCEGCTQKRKFLSAVPGSSPCPVAEEACQFWPSTVTCGGVCYSR